MAIITSQNTKIAVEIETTEGEYVAPTGGTSYVQTLAEGTEISPSKELIERNILTGTIGKVTPRTGTRSVTGTLPTECRAHSSEGAAPEFDKLMQAGLGLKRQNTTTVTTKIGNTASVLQIEDADISQLRIGDIVLVKKAQAYHVSPIIARSTGLGTSTVTLLVPHPSGLMTDGVELAKFTTYGVAENGHPTLSITRYQENAVKMAAMGCRPSSISLDNFSTGQIPSLSFGFEGVDFDKELQVPSHTPSYDSALPPIVLDARAYMDGEEITINQLSVSIDNTVSFATSIAKANGKIYSRITSRAITGSINPYLEDDSIGNFERFRDNAEFSLFAYAKNPTGIEGEFENIVAIYLPNCLATEISEADQDGLVQETISFTASRGTSGTEDELFITFI